MDYILHFQHTYYIDRHLSLISIIRVRQECEVADVGQENLAWLVVESGGIRPRLFAAPLFHGFSIHIPKLRMVTRLLISKKVYFCRFCLVVRTRVFTTYYSLHIYEPVIDHCGTNVETCSLCLTVNPVLNPLLVEIRLGVLQLFESGNLGAELPDLRPSTRRQKLQNVLCQIDHFDQKLISLS